MPGLLKYDKNGDGTVCWKTRPDSQPAFVFNAVDNTAKIKPGSFDRVLCLSVLEHLDHDRRRAKRGPRPPGG